MKIDWNKLNDKELRQIYGYLDIAKVWVDYYNDEGNLRQLTKELETIKKVQEERKNEPTPKIPNLVG